MPSLEGWCSPKKAALLQRWVTSLDAQTCVEIGVFGGASLIPQALACQAKGSGKVFGIEPYSHAVVAQEVSTGADRDWWQQVDFPRIRAGFVAAVARLQLAPYVELLEMTSGEAQNRFRESSIDVLHVDGNHAESAALLDVLNYLPKVRSGGAVFIDDISWGLNRFSRATTGPAIDATLRECSWVGVVDQCLICQKR